MGSTPQQYYVCSQGDEHKGWMDGCMVWWRPEGKGYTYDLNFAGLFTDEDRAKNYPPRDACRYIPREIVDANSYAPRLAFWSRSRIHDAGPICEALAEAAVQIPATPSVVNKAAQGETEAFV